MQCSIDLIPTIRSVGLQEAAMSMFGIAGGSRSRSWWAMGDNTPGTLYMGSRKSMSTQTLVDAGGFWYQ